MSETKVSLDVIIVGGSIGGLSSAIALRRAGHHVTVYERRAADFDSGAGIVLGANATRVLNQWGMDLATVGAHPWSEGLLIDGKTLSVLNRIPGQVGHANLTRKDLRLLLAREVDRTLSPKECQGSIRVIYDQRILAYDADKPAVQFSDGTWAEADLVIACDGIKSRAAKVVLGREVPATATGYSAFRLIIPTDGLEDVRKEFTGDEMIRTRLACDNIRAPVWFAVEHPGRILVWWTCRFGQANALDIIIPDNDKYASSEEWLARCDKKVLIDEFGHWHPVFKEVLKVAEDPLLWKICDRDPVGMLYRKNLCILGDALHPMGPYRSQGASQSIEDAGALEMCLTGLKDRSEVPARLELLQKLRLPRYATCQLLSSVRQDEPDIESRFAEVLRDCKKWFAANDQSAPENRQEFNRWLNDYDVRAVARKAVNEVWCQALD